MLLVRRWVQTTLQRSSIDDRSKPSRRPYRRLTTDDGVTGIVLTDHAAAKVKALLEQEGRADLALRVAVQPGGCSGLRYQLFFDDRSLDGDRSTTSAA